MHKYVFKMSLSNEKYTAVLYVFSLSLSPETFAMTFPNQNVYWILMTTIQSQIWADFHYSQKKNLKDFTALHP